MIKQHSISERVLKIGPLVCEFIYYKQKYKSFLIIILVYIYIRIRIILLIYCRYPLQQLNLLLRKVLWKTQCLWFSKILQNTAIQNANQNNVPEFIFINKELNQAFLFHYLCIKVEAKRFSSLL